MGFSMGRGAPQLVMADARWNRRNPICYQWKPKRSAWAANLYETGNLC